MNESLRVPKLNFSEKLNSVYRTYWWNVVASVLILAPVALFSRRFFISRGGLPMTYVYLFCYVALITSGKWEATTTSEKSHTIRLFFPSTLLEVCSSLLGSQIGLPLLMLTTSLSTNLQKSCDCKIKYIIIHTLLSSH